MKWEYLKLNNLSEIELNDFGQAGWELVGFIQQPWFVLYIFKRPL